MGNTVLDNLLPYKDKPVLAHIIDNFPHNTRFVIPVGYLKEQIIDFCKVAILKLLMSGIPFTVLASILK